MKIAVITYTRTKNYGGILQAYGLYSYLYGTGRDVVFIDYIPERCNVNNLEVYTESITRLSKIWGRNNLTKKMWQLIRYPSIKAGYKPFLEFLDQRVKFTKPYYSIEELQNDPPQADVYITGSDQVWNSSFLPGERVDLPFYLGFVDGKKISYASSFGKTYIPDDNVKVVTSYLKEYAHLSVREESGRNIISQLGFLSEVVVDPTMLCDFSTWDELTKSVPEKNYILLYQVRFSSEIYKMAKKMAKKMGKQLLTVSMNPQDKGRIRHGLVMLPSVPEWLSYIKYADYVVTDSFHAGVFSILFHKKFVINSGIRKGMSSRILTLLKMVGIEDRELNGFSVEKAIQVLNQEIDWDKVEKLLNKKRELSRAWLEGSIES